MIPFNTSRRARPSVTRLVTLLADKAIVLIPGKGLALLSAEFSFSRPCRYRWWPGMCST